MRFILVRGSARCRRAVTTRGLLIAMGVVGSAVALIYAALPRFSQSGHENGPLIHRVQPADFVHEITEKGNVESASNIEVRCMVQSLNSAGTRILWIVPEGTYVKKGEKIVQLDSSALENDSTKQMIVRANSRAMKIQAENDVKTAKIAKREYLGETLRDALGDIGGELAAAVPRDRAALWRLAETNFGSRESVLELRRHVSERTWSRTVRVLTLLYRHVFQPNSLGGKYRQEEQKLESDLFVAEENFRRAEEYYKYSQILAAKGYVTSIQLEADRFAMDQSEKARESAKTSLKVLREYTKRKTEMQLESDIATANAKLEAAQHTLRLDEDKLELIDDQIIKCNITAPDNGQVVYATNSDRWGGSEVIIEEGALVRERQVIIRLPDPKRMQVKAKVNESKVALVAEGQVAAVRLDAFPDIELRGVVQKVNEYPAQSAWYAANIKEYDTIVRIEDSTVALRPGLTAEVKIRVAQQSNVLQAPVQAVLEHAGKYYCAVPDGESWAKRDVTIGLTNDKFVVIREGLEAGDQVALNIAAVRDKIGLPEVKIEPSKVAAAEPGGGDKLPAGEAKAKAAGQTAKQPDKKKGQGRGQAAGKSGPEGKPSGGGA